MDNTQYNTLCTNIRIKASPHRRLCTKFFRGCQIHLRSIIGRRCCISIRQYPKQRIYLQIFLHDQSCVIFEWSQFMQFCSACTYPAFGGHSRLFSRQEEKSSLYFAIKVWKAKVRKSNILKQEADTKALTKKITKSEKRVAELDHLIKRIMKIMYPGSCRISVLNCCLLITKRSSRN